MEYDRSKKFFDEPYSPVELDLLVNNKTINQGKFLSQAHAESYLCQMQLIASLSNVNSVLEIGPGEGYCARNLSELGYEYDTLDFEHSSYAPTIRADFRTLTVASVAERYDLTCAFQVLEHFPYSEFPKHLATLSALSKHYVLISLPYSCRGFSIDVRLHNGQQPWMRKRLALFFPTNLPNRKYREEFKQEFPWAVHYWEIGRRGFSLKKVLRDIESSGLAVEQRFHSHNPFHYHILCKKQPANAT